MTLVELALTRHQELDHHEIGQQDVGFGLSDALAFFGVFLPGVSGKGRAQIFRQAGLVEKFVEFFGLAVGQSIHWVDHDCSRALLFALGARTDGRIDEPTFDALSPGVHGRDAIAILPVTIGAGRPRLLLPT